MVTVVSNGECNRDLIELRQISLELVAAYPWVANPLFRSPAVRKRGSREFPRTETRVFSVFSVNCYRGFGENN